MKNKDKQIQDADRICSTNVNRFIILNPAGVGDSSKFNADAVVYAHIGRDIGIADGTFDSKSIVYAKVTI